MTNDKFEKLIKDIMAEAEADGEPITYDEAKEMAEMEVNAKVNLKNYAQSDKPRKKSDKPKTVKVSDTKKQLFTDILHLLDRCEGVERENITVLTENKLIQVKIGGETFKIDLIQQRKPKK